MSAFAEDDDEDDLACTELMVLQSMYDTEELKDVVVSPTRTSFHLSFVCADDIPVSLSCSVDRTVYGKKIVPCKSLFSLSCPSLKSSLVEKLLDSIRSSVDDDSDGDESAMKIVLAIELLKENVVAAAAAQDEESQAQRNENVDGPNKIEKRRKECSFCREWCSFVALYKESYSSGPDRFTVIRNLATTRNLDITGIAIAGKPGGLVVEGREDHVEEFMLLMRTEFFETLNPRGRKLTTRWQERLPYDEELNRFECAEAIRNLENDKNFEGKKDRRLAIFREKDEEIVSKFGRKMDEKEVSELIGAGPPSLKCEYDSSQNSVYGNLMEEMTTKRISAMRKWKDFSVITNDKNDYEGCYQEAGRVLTSMGLKEGFDAMFSYRFS